MHEVTDKKTSFFFWHRTCTYNLINTLTMKTIKKITDINEFELEKICHLLECSHDDIINLYSNAENVVKSSENTYDTLMKILQQGNNLREAVLIALICGKSIGQEEARNKMEEDIKDKLFNAFKQNSSL